MVTTPLPDPVYPARLTIDRPERLDRVTTAFRLVLALPILVVIALLSANGDDTVRVVNEAGQQIATYTRSTGGIAAGLFAATALLILFRRRYPRWWFDFAFLWIGAFVAVLIAWFAILFTGRYPQPLFDYVVGVGRWSLRVQAYATLLVTDRYPPFRLS
jgi:hypothetical protein